MTFVINPQNLLLSGITLLTVFKSGYYRLVEVSAVSAFSPMCQVPFLDIAITKFLAILTFTLITLFALHFCLATPLECLFFL